MDKDKAPLLAQISFYLSGIGVFWIGIALYYVTKDKNAALASCAKSGSIMGLILDLLGIVTLVLKAL